MGDVLKEVNSIPVEGKKPEDVIQILVCERETCVYARVCVCLDIGMVAVCLE